MTSGNKPLEPRAFWYILSFVIPLLGIIIGVIYTQKPEPLVKAFGRNCIISSIASILLCGLCYFIFFVCNAGS